MATALVQRLDAPPLGIELLAAALTAPLALWAASRFRRDPRRRILMLAATAPVALMFVSGLSSGFPQVSLLGVSPEWQGWLLWATTLVWFWVMLVGADGTDTARVVHVLSWLGGLTAVWALLEAGGVIPTYQFRDGLTAMAMFDSSMSLGQALIITLAATVSVLLKPRLSRDKRLVCAALAVVQVAALVVSGSRAALAGLVLGAAAWGLFESAGTKRGRLVRTMAAASIVAFATAFAAVMSAWAGVLGPRVHALADSLLSNRFVVWDQAVRRIGPSLLTGIGPAPFDPVIEWGVRADGSIAASLAFDPHNILLTWLSATGLLGLAVFGCAACVIGVHIVRSVRALGSTPSVRALAAAGPAVFFAMLFSWPEPFALISISVIVGSLISNGSLRLEPSASWGRERPGTLTRTPYVATAVGGLGLAIALSPSIAARLHTAHAADYRQLVSKVDSAARVTGDGSYLAHELYLMSEKGRDAASDEEALATLRRHAGEYPAEAARRVEIPLLALEILWKRAAVMSGDEFFALTRFFAERGADVDPDLGIWRFALARAARLTHPADESVYVDAALSADLPDSARLFITHVR